MLNLKIGILGFALSTKFLLIVYVIFKFIFIFIKRAVQLNNPYKRNDVFACDFSRHSEYNFRVSAYHVLLQKKCYPKGCLMFKWTCSLMNKGKKCIRGYNFVGRLCEGCNYYHDEKVHLQPRLLLSNNDFEKFETECDEFNEWIDENQDRDMTIYVQIHNVKPNFRKTVYGSKGRLFLDGFILNIRHGYFDTCEFDDFFYIKSSLRQQDVYRFAAGDKFEARGRFLLDSGRIIFNKIWAIEFDSRSLRKTWDKSRALVARQSATHFDYQPEKCIECPKGALVDVIINNQGKVNNKRELYCLEGIKDPGLCWDKIKDKINSKPEEIQR